MMNITEIQWQEITKDRSKKSDIVKFFVIKNKSGSFSGIVYLSPDVIKKAGLKEGGYAKIFTNPQDIRQLLVKPCAEKDGYKISKISNKKYPARFSRVGFRLPLSEKDIQERDYKARNVEHIIDEENDGIMIDTN